LGLALLSATATKASTRGGTLQRSRETLAPTYGRSGLLVPRLSTIL